MPENTYQLTIPLDASDVEGFEPDQKVKVVVQDAKKRLQSKNVALSARGKGSATFKFRRKPTDLQVSLGPEDATDEEITGMQTLHVAVAARSWRQRELKIRPVLITPFFWHRWRKWCRTYIIRGRVVCADGSPVPGAEVCAYDVEFWWWWSSSQKVACAITDASGSFKLKFRWCCGFLPWWWWRRRIWKLEPVLADHILPVLQKKLRLRRPPIPRPRPDAEVFTELLDGGGQPITLDRRRTLVDPTKLETLRERLIGGLRLPEIPQLERLRLWPWWPWRPWLDCRPDLIFKVTQDCEQPGTVIVDENVFDTRWNVPTESEVTLVAGSEACCLPEPEPEPDERCVLLSEVCGITVNQIGGNPGAPPTPAGYVSPGVGDRPFADLVRLQGRIFNVDYYRFEFSEDGGATWDPVPAPAAGSFTRRYWEPPFSFTNVTFNATPIDGELVFETRRHYEATHDPATWNVSRYWTTRHYFTLMNWLTRNNHDDGAIRLRLRGWDLVGGHLANEELLPVCATQDPNGLVLRIDNRFVGGASGHPTAPDHPCGGGTVHFCTREPDTDILDVRIGGASIGACDSFDASEGGSLEIDFLAHDIDGHLHSYRLQATFGENGVVNLLNAPGAALSPSPFPAPVPPAAQVGNTYAQALAQGAVSPVWHGGAIRLTIPDVSQAFEVTCCYQLELRAYKRTIVNCDGDFDNHRNLSEYSFMVTV